MVNDHRTELKSGNVDAVLDGEIDEFIQAYLLRARTAAEEGGSPKTSNFTASLWIAQRSPVEDGCG